MWLRQKTAAVVSLLAVAAFGAAQGPGTEAKKDLERMTGTWAVIEAENDGKAVPADVVKKMKLVQKQAEWTFYGDDEAVSGKDKLDPSKTPRAVDTLMTAGRAKGKTVLGIYEIKGDTMKVCWAEPGRPRPTAFTAQPGSGRHFLLLKRQKAE
jgi:uncharacterized protein (TIGR03067 family)